MINAYTSEILEDLKFNTIDLRVAVCRILEHQAFNDHIHPEIDNLIFLVRWLEKHLKNSGFAEYEPYRMGDFDPTKPNVWLMGLHLLLEHNYDQPEEVEIIKKRLVSDDFTPSEALRILGDHWQLYIAPNNTCKVNEMVEYCVICADDFPDTEEERLEFERILEIL